MSLTQIGDRANALPLLVWLDRHLPADSPILRIVRSYVAYYNKTRTHLALGKDPPDPRPIQTVDAGEIVAIPEVGGLHHRYGRRLAA